jgi:hypothetical protein
VTGLAHVWAQVWPNLLSSVITFAVGSVWHLVLVRRTLRHHQNVIEQRLTAQQRALGLTDLEDENDGQRD